MTREEIKKGLKFTIDMFKFDPLTGEERTLNDLDATTVNACEEAIKALEQESTTKNCESCEYYGLHHEVCNYCYKCSLWTEPTTKNDLEVDCISRPEVIDYLCKHCPDDGECFKDCDEIKHLREMPSVIPQEPILDKIRAEIEKLQKMCDKNDLNLMAQYSAFGMVLDIIDKYKVESEDAE